LLLETHGYREKRAMKFADDVYLTPFGIWLKRKIIMTGKLVEMIFEKQDKSTAPPRQIAHEGKGALDRKNFLGSRGKR
jgi:hypothetical protein